MSELLDKIRKVKKHVERVINIPPETIRRVVYLENREKTDDLNEYIKQVVKAFNTLDQRTLVRIISLSKHTIVKTFELINIESVEDELQLSVLIDEELTTNEEEDTTDDLPSNFTKTRLVKSVLLATIVIMAIVFLDQPKLAAYVYMLFITLWFIFRLIERQLFDLSILPTVRELLPWFCILLAVSVILKKSIPNTFKYVIHKCKEHEKVFYVVLGVHVTQLVIRLSTWYKLVNLVSTTPNKSNKEE